MSNIEPMWHIVLGLRLLGVPAKQISEILHIDIKTVYEWQKRLIPVNNKEEFSKKKNTDWQCVLTHQLKKRKITPPKSNQWSVPTLPKNEIFLTKEQINSVEDIHNKFLSIIGETTTTAKSANNKFIKLVWVQPIPSTLVKRYNPFTKEIMPSWTVFHKKIIDNNQSSIDELLGLNYWLACIGVSKRFNKTTSLLLQSIHQERFKSSDIDILRNINDEIVYDDILDNIGRNSPLSLKRNLLRERRKSKAGFISDLAFIPVFEEHGFIYIFEYPISSIPPNMLYPSSIESSNSRISFFYPEHLESKLKDSHGDIEQDYKNRIGYERSELIDDKLSVFNKFFTGRW